MAETPGISFSGLEGHFSFLFLFFNKGPQLMVLRDPGPFLAMHGAGDAMQCQGLNSGPHSC